MTLKRRIAIGVSIVFSLVFGLAATLVYLSFATFRKEEFFERLEEKALTTAKLLVEVNEVDKQLLRLIDKNTINRLYNEKTLVFDENFKLIYSSIDDATIRWKLDDLKRLKVEKQFFRSDGAKDMLGIFYDFDREDYYVLVAAEDKYGYSKLAYLRYSLILMFVLGTALVWTSTNYIIRRLLKPLDEFQEQITTITANNLSIQLDEGRNSDEINVLASAFNRMLFRIESSFRLQREFTANASHELRTPLSRLAFQLENLIALKTQDEGGIEALKGMLRSVHELSDLVNSLLLLSRMDQEELRKTFHPERLDEIVYVALEKVRRLDPEFDVRLEVGDHDGAEHCMEVFGVKSLLEIALANLLKNASLYSEDHRAEVSVIQEDEHHLHVRISNKGRQLAPEEEMRIFEPFTRAGNSQHIAGSGLGLVITKRILNYHNASVNYSWENGYHRFELIFLN